VKGERAENQPSRFKSAIKHGMGRHPSTKGMPTKPERKRRSLLSGSERCGNGGGRDRREIGSALAGFHEREVKS
jgi:hypothetical protein